MGTKTQKLSNVVDQIVEWQSVIVADGSTNTTAVAGRGYFIDTSAGTHTINLPASPKIGDVVKVSLITAGNELTIGRNGNNINGASSDLTTSNDGDAFELVYANVNEGWKSVGQVTAANFITATGGTVTTSGDYKVHTFTGDGCFVVSLIGNGADNPLGGPSTVDYLVVAGGGAGGPGYAGGGGGAGGFRVSNCATRSGISAPTMSPLATPTGITISTTTYPVTVGGGGSTTSFGIKGTTGSNSVFSTITSAGGGGGGTSGPAGAPNPSVPACGSAGPGGSGGGAGGKAGDVSNPPSAGTGNTPPVAPPQGNPGGNAGADGFAAFTNTAGGGGAGGAGTTGSAQCVAATGGAGSYVSNTLFGPVSGCYGEPGPVGSTRYFGGGGGGGTDNPPANPVPQGLGGVGGGGDGSTGVSPFTGTAGIANTGGGGGGGGGGAVPSTPGSAGGKGIVIIRYKFQ